MSNNINLFSVGTSTKVNVNTSVKTQVKSTNQTTEFSKTLDQAQQSRDKSTDTLDSRADNVTRNDAQPAKDEPVAQDATQEAVKSEDMPKTEKANSDEAPKADEAKATDKANNAEPVKQPEDATEVTVAAQTLAAAAEGAFFVQEQQPLAELNTYFQGDIRLQNAALEAANMQQGVQPQQGMAVQAQNTDQPLDSLQPVNVMEEVAPVTNVESVQSAETVETTANVQPQAQQYAPNSIEALLGTKQTATQASTANVVQAQSSDQHLLNLITGQSIMPSAQQQVDATEAQNTVPVSDLADVVGQVQIVQPQNVDADGEGQQNLMQNQNQQGMTNGQGQQQGAQLEGEAAFDVVLPGSDEAPKANTEQSAQNSAIGFQQVLNNTQSDNITSVQQPQQAQQPTETYNVPQQIVEQARLLQNGENSEMVIKLNPEHLGELSLKVSVNGNGGVTATFHTDNAQVRAILETTMIQLKDQLNEQGIKVDSVEVQTGLPDGQLPQDQGQQGYYQQQGEEVRSQAVDLKDFEETSEALSAEPVNNATADIHDSEGNVISIGVDYSV